ncbi:MAG: hypothetical protein AB7U75_14700 [Hyphomicrobiaceae bacterium]
METAIHNLQMCARDVQEFAHAATTMGFGHLADKLYCIGAEIEASVERLQGILDKVQGDGSIG